MNESIGSLQTGMTKSKKAKIIKTKQNTFMNESIGSQQTGMPESKTAKLNKPHNRIFIIIE